MSPPRKPRDLWDDEETSPEDVERGTANRAKVLEGLIEHALTSDALDSRRVAQWQKDCLLGLSYVTDDSWLGAYRGSDHPDLKNLLVGVSRGRRVGPRRVGKNPSFCKRQRTDGPTHRELGASALSTTSSCRHTSKAGTSLRTGSGCLDAGRPQQDHVIHFASARRPAGRRIGNPPAIRAALRRSA